MMTAHNMLSKKGHQAKQVSIVACGPAVKDLQTSSPVASKVKQSLDNDIRIVACGVTVDRMGLDKDSFISGVVVVPNGITELARLQANGYVSIEL
jgi:intracellular sulfur oxidation DsrE/DsrF family protein